MGTSWVRLLRAPLHVTHALNLTLTVLFLLLGGITGCRKDFWWLTVSYGLNGDTSADVWNIGGIKACRIGNGCERGQPKHYGDIQALLIWHIAAAVIFLIVSLVTYWLILRPMKRKRSHPMAYHWWTFALPFAVLLLPIITLVADIMVRHNFRQKQDVSRVDTKAAFWLSALGIVSAGLWAVSLEWIRWDILKVRKGSGRSRKVEEEPRSKWDPWSLWPWGQRRGDR